MRTPPRPTRVLTACRARTAPMTAKHLIGRVALVGLTTVVGGAVAHAASRFEPGPCPVSVGQHERVSCGWLVVPERRARPMRREVRLAVAVIHPPAPLANADPLLYVTGGPGFASLLVNVPRFLAEPLVTDRDVVLVDLRGTGASLPSLACPEVDEGALLAAPSRDVTARRRNVREITACRARLRREGVDLRAYDYAEMAADLDDLRRGLGIDSWSVYGISNGGRLALELVRRYPAGVRSLVLDAALAPQGNVFLELLPHARRAFDAFFGACAADPGCAAAHPDLGARFAALVERLRDDPVVVTVLDGGTGAPRTVVIDDAVALQALHGGLYDSGLIPFIPALIEGLSAGSGLDVLAGPILEGADPPPAEFSLGQQLSDSCREEVAFFPPGAVRRQARRFPDLAPLIETTDIEARCRAWRAGRARAIVDRPVRSDIPTLLLVGSLDPIHPRDSSEAIASHLSRARLFECPGLGHGTVLAHRCPRDLMRAFLTDPERELDATCIAGMPGAFGATPSR